MSRCSITPSGCWSRSSSRSRRSRPVSSASPSVATAASPHQAAVIVDTGGVGPEGRDHVQRGLDHRHRRAAARRREPGDLRDGSGRGRLPALRSRARRGAELPRRRRTATAGTGRTSGPRRGRPRSSTRRLVAVRRGCTTVTSRAGSSGPVPRRRSSLSHHSCRHRHHRRPNRPRLLHRPRIRRTRTRVHLLLHRERLRVRCRAGRWRRA